MYPLLTNVCLPIDGSFLGIFKLPGHDWTSRRTILFTVFQRGHTERLPMRKRQNDLMIATEIGNIASLLDQNTIEITTILSNTLAHTNETLIFFNHINNKISFVEMSLERCIDPMYRLCILNVLMLQKTKKQLKIMQKARWNSIKFSPSKHNFPHHAPFLTNNRIVFWWVKKHSIFLRKKQR